MGNDTAAQTGVDALTRDFAEDPELAGLLCKLGNISWQHEKYDWAAELYQYVIDKWPKTEHEMRAKMGIAKLNISLGDDAAVEATIDSLIADFNDNPALPEVVFVIGEEYYNEAFRCEKEGLDAEAKDNFKKAIAIWERIITELQPNAMYPAQAYCFSGHCYRKLGEYEKSTAYYQYVVANYPEHRTAWQALFRIAHNYEDMKDLGIISKTEADPVIKTAYQQFLEKYPDCKMAGVARRWLSRHNSK